MDNILPTETDNQDPINILNTNDATAEINDISKYYEDSKGEIEIITQEVESLTNIYNSVNELLVKNTYILENEPEKITDNIVHTVQESFLKLAEDTPIRDRVEDAYDINLEAFVSQEEMLGNILTNIIEFLRNLYKLILQKITQIMSLFKKGRFKITTIIGKIILRSTRLQKVLKDLQNSDKEYFNRTFKGSDYEELVNNLVNETPGYFIGSYTLERILNFRSFLDYINPRTSELVKFLNSTLITFNGKIKNSEYDENVPKELYETFIEFASKTKDLKGKDWEFTVTEWLNKKSTFDSKAKYPQVLLFDKHDITYSYAVKSKTNTDEILYTLSSSIDKIDKVTLPSQLTYNYLYQEISTGLGNFITDMMLVNRDKVYDVLNQYSDTIDLCQTMLKNVNRIDPDKLKSITMVINKNIYPILYKLLLKQYVNLVLQYNTRLAIAEKLIVEMNKNANA